MNRRDLLEAGAVSTLALASKASWAHEISGGAITPFAFRASDMALADLNRRLDQTRWPDRGTAERWEQGPPLAAMQELIDYWRGRYDWRRCEAEFSQWPHFTTQLDGLSIHFVHVRSRHKGALPVILTHGWPSTFLLFRHVIAPLVDPTAHGGTVADAFDVVVPSLPGFAFSDRPKARGWNAKRIARAWGALMQRLGYRRYVAQGGDWGAFVTTAMAQQPTAGLVAIHLNFAQTLPDVLPDRLLPDQQRAVQSLRTWFEKGFAFGRLQGTRPQVVSYSLADSPVGQASWIYDIFNAGTGQTGRPEDALSRDDMLDEITLYWLTDTAGSSARLYLEQAELLGAHHNPGRVDMPVAVSVYPNEVVPAARSWALQVYPNLVYWSEVDRGGHFASLEVPELFTEELRRCFRAFRRS